jgi:magnesium transporter
MAHPVDNRKAGGDVQPMPETSAAAAPTSRLHLHQSKKVGMLPGSLVHIGQAAPMASRISVIEYDVEHHAERDVEDLGKEPNGCRRHTDPGSVVWVNVDGNSNADTIAALGDRFGLHPLVLEDLMNAGERTKLEEHDDCLFVVLKMLAVDEKDDIVVVEQISLILGRGFVLSVQERAGDVFDAVRERLRQNKGRIRRMGADYLLYALIDAIVDHYAVALEAMAGLVEDMDEVLQESPARVGITDLYLLKREVLFLRRQIAPARDLFAELNREGSEQSLISSAVDVYFRDVLDHCTRATEHADLLREMTMSMVDMYHSLQSARLNEVMRILTVISTIFIPLTFIAGVYGMNFDVMPELRHPLGYYICVGVMAVIAIGMVVYVKRNRWL